MSTTGSLHYQLCMGITAKSLAMEEREIPCLHGNIHCQTPCNRIVAHNTLHPIRGDLTIFLIFNSELLHQEPMTLYR